MEEAVVFDQLVRELDDQERRALLVRIQSSTPVYCEPLQPQKDGAAAFILEQELAGLSLPARIVLFFRSLFSRRDPAEVLQQRYLRRLAADIERRFPTLIDFQARRFRDGMYEQLLALRKHLRSLYDPLQEVMSRHPGQFIAFLARHELKEFQLTLEQQTDPRQLWEQGAFRDEKQVRTVMLQRFYESLETIPKTGVREVGREARSLFALHELSSHSFDALLAAFEGEQNPSADFKAATSPLKQLADRLEPVRVPPTAQVLYDLFLFLHQRRLEDKDFDLENQLMADMSTVHAALAGIRRFHDRIPLHSILRWVTRDPAYRPAAPKPAADWFSLFKEFWHQWVHRRYVEFYQSCRRDELIADSLEFLGLKSLPQLTNYRSDRFGARIPVRYELSLAFITGFIETPFARLSRALKLIYLNAEFYKEENRRAYTDAFLFLEKGKKNITAFESTLGPRGSFRAAIQDVKGQSMAESLRRKRILDILTRADTEARTLVDGFLEQIENLKSLLYGILKGQPGDRYDTLMNLNKIGGRENRDLRDAWSSALERCERAAALLRSIRELEVNREIQHHAGKDES